MHNDSSYGNATETAQGVTEQFLDGGGVEKWDYASPIPSFHLALQNTFSAPIL